MSRLLRRPTRVFCFFCQSEAQPRDPRSFRCSQCGCWNRYDAHGEIVSDEPAMHDESMNTRSFAKRASPRKDRFMSTYGPAIFCHTCQTNQMLVSNLLSNYLPPPNDPEYSRLNAQLPAYRNSLETRYPPVCISCLPAVEEEIKRRDNMARASALGILLKQSKGKGKERQRQNSGRLSHKPRVAPEKELFIWKVRGGLWLVTLVSVLSAYGHVLSGHPLIQLPTLLRRLLPIFILLSITWTAWDPRYATFKRAQLQGREVRLRGKREYNTLQTLAWLSRLMTTSLLSLSTFDFSWDIFRPAYLPQYFLPAFVYRAVWYYRLSLVLELCILIRSLIILRIDTPPPVRLMEQYSHRPSLPLSDTSQQPSRQQTPIVDPAQDLISSLTLSNNPVLTNINRTNAASPVFGQPSLAQPNGHVKPNGHIPIEIAVMDDDMGVYEMDDDLMEDDDDEQRRDPDAMDWSPIHPTHRNQRYISSIRLNSAKRDDVNLRPQRFFAPEEPTGLENLFETTIKLADDDLVRREDRRKQSGWKRWVTGSWS